MTREEAKKEIEKVFEPAFANYIIKALTDGATESDVEPQEWISVKDRLLDEWEIKGKKAELWIINGKLQVRYLGTIHNVELPSPYEGE